MSAQRGAWHVRSQVDQPCELDLPVGTLYGLRPGGRWGGRRGCLLGGRPGEAVAALVAGRRAAVISAMSAKAPKGKRPRAFTGRDPWSATAAPPQHVRPGVLPVSARGPDGAHAIG